MYGLRSQRGLALAGRGRPRLTAYWAPHTGANEFSTGRALLRRASALYGFMFRQPFQQVRMETGVPEYPDVHFNLSHARNRVVLTISSEQAMGVDIEHLDRQLRSRALAKRNCHPNELLALEDLDDESHRQAFLEMWVRKEAVLGGAW